MPTTESILTVHLESGEPVSLRLSDGTQVVGTIEAIDRLGWVRFAAWDTSTANESTTIYINPATISVIALVTL